MRIVLFLTVLLVVGIQCAPRNRKQELAQLGKSLFFDNRLSYNQTKSCASCHDPKFAFTDSYIKSIGSTGELHQRNSKTLLNVKDNYYLTAADSTIHSLEQQMLNPMLRTHPIELGMAGHELEILDRFKNDKQYAPMLQANFGTKNIKLADIQKAIAAYVRTLKTKHAKYDAYSAGDHSVLNANEEAGRQLFFSNRLACAQCHGGADFDEPNAALGTAFFNTGIYNIDGKGAYPSDDIGLMQITNAVSDMGKFKVPTLRNLLYTAPYYHDGSAAKLMDVIKDYNNGGRLISIGINKGNGAINPYKHPLVKGLQLTTTEQQQVLAFLLCLSDTTSKHY